MPGGQWIELLGVLPGLGAWGPPCLPHLGTGVLPASSPPGHGGPPRLLPTWAQESSPPPPHLGMGVLPASSPPGHVGWGPPLPPPRSDQSGRLTQVLAPVPPTWGTSPRRPLKGRQPQWGEKTGTARSRPAPCLSAGGLAAGEEWW